MTASIVDRICEYINAQGCGERVEDFDRATIAAIIAEHDAEKDAEIKQLRQQLASITTPVAARDKFRETRFTYYLHLPHGELVRLLTDATTEVERLTRELADLRKIVYVTPYDMVLRRCIDKRNDLANFAKEAAEAMKEEK